MGSALREKSALLAFFLCLFFGLLGLHRFYLGKIVTGLLMIFTFGGFGIWYISDLSRILLVLFSRKRASKQTLTVAVTENSVKA